MLQVGRAFGRLHTQILAAIAAVAARPDSRNFYRRGPTEVAGTGASGLNSTVEALQEVRGAIGYLRTECKVLLKFLAGGQEAGLLSRLAESWRSVGERLENTPLHYGCDFEVFSKVQEGLQRSTEAATAVQAALAFGQTDQLVIDKVRSLKDPSEELLAALEALLHRLQDYTTFPEAP